MSEVLASLKCSMASQRPSEIRTTQALLPSTQSQLEFELMIRHSNVYAKMIPSATAMELSGLFWRRRDPSQEWTSTRSLLMSYDAVADDDHKQQTLIAGSPSPLRGTPDRRTSLLCGPLRGPTYCDPRLEYLDIGYWTKVPVSNGFAACLISLYLENEHPIIGTFDAETFLDDIVASRLEFCSSFLVNAVLALACVC